jgi:serine/threonine-protein kinase
MAATPDPTRIGRYHVVERLGRGAMGTVYRAHDPQIGRTVAIKVLHVDDDELRRRFRREVQSAGTLKHPNIVTVHDYGEEGGQPFIVMEYVEGRTLADLLRVGHQFSLSEKLHLARQLCSALDYAHDQGVIHRDIKPANLMIGRDGNLRVVDFGIARMGDGDLTRTGTLIGTLKYMSPEQIDGAELDRRTDIFSVGAVLYELLSSHQAFQGDSPSRVMRAILHEEPPALTGLCPDIDSELVRVVDTAMRKDRSQRYTTLRQVDNDLAAVEARLRVDAGAGTLVLDRGRRSASQPATAAAARNTVAAEWTFIGMKRGSLAIGLALVAATAAGAALALVLASRPATTSPGPSSASSSSSSEPARVPSVRPVAPAETEPRPSESTVSPSENGTGATRSGEPAGKASDPDPRDTRIALPIPTPTPTPNPGPTPTPTPTPYEAARALLASSEPDSQRKAAGLLQEACDSGELRACVELAQLFERGTGVARDLSRAAALYERGCGRGNGTACLRAGLLHRDGEGAVRNQPESLQWFQRACDAGAREGCFNLGLAYARGTAVASDESKAASLYQQACDAGLPPACDALGRAYQDARGVVQNNALARSLFERACNAGGMPACVDLATMLAQGLGGPPDQARAVALFQRGCDAGVPVGCGRLAFAYARGRGVPRDDARAVSLYQRACDAGGAPACGDLAAMYTAGLGVPRDAARSIQLLHRACDGNAAASCRELSQRYEQGRDGVERNPARAAELMRRAQQLSGGRGDDTSGPIGGVPQQSSDGNGQPASGGGAQQPSGNRELPPAGRGTQTSGVVGGVAGPTRGQRPQPPPPPTAPVRVGGAIKPPVQTKRVEAVYPAAAQKQRVQGIVILEIVIGPQGKVTDAKVMRSVPLLDQAAVDAVKQWEYTPTVVDGVPVPVLATVTVNFRLAAPSDGRGGSGRGRR